MEARKLTQKDLWKVFGSKGITSEVFHGKRGPSAKPRQENWPSFFHVNIELFIRFGTLFRIRSPQQTAATPQLPQ